MNGRRAFAEKLLKDSNVDVRHRLAKILSNSDCDSNQQPPPPPPATSSISSLSFSQTEDALYPINYYCDTPINDLVDPVDYEKYIFTNQSRIATNLRSVLLFPEDDVQVEKYQLPLRTLECSVPELNNVQTLEDPYIQCVGGVKSKSLIVKKNYEKFTSVVAQNNERLNQAKELKRLEYEVDLNSKNGDTDSDFNSETPNTFYSRDTSVKSTPRPQSLVSTSSTIRPPLASDEEDFTDDDEEMIEIEVPTRSKAKQEPFKSYDSKSCDIPSSDHEQTNRLNRKSYQDCTSLNGLIEHRHSWIYTDSSCNLERLSSTFGSKTKSLLSLQNSQSDPHIKGILDKNFYGNFFESFDRLYEHDNPDCRIVPIFRLHPMQHEDDSIEARPAVPPPSDVPRFKFILRCLTLKMKLSIEPIFASIAIYDAKERKKVTENFYFDMNPESLKKPLRSHIQYQDLISLSKTTIFSLSQLSAEMYFVIKFEKVLQSDLNELIDAYTRVLDEAKVEKLKSSSNTNCERLGRYRMPLAWIAFPLVDILHSGQVNSETDSTEESDSAIQSRSNSSSLDSLKRIEFATNFVRKGSLERHSTFSNCSNMSTLSSLNSLSSAEKRYSISSDELAYAHSTFKPVTITSKLFYRYEGDKFSDEDLYKFLQEFKRPAFSLKRLRCIQGLLKIDIRSLSEEPPCAVNPELLPISPFNNEEQASPVKELLEFRDLPIPHLEYRNLLYVYPKSLNFTNGPGSSRNISIKIQLLNSEEKFSALPLIFGKSSCPQMLSEAYTFINYHNRCPNFHEEFKIRLPSKVNKQTHLLFTFIHVHTKPKNDTPVDEVVGYSWLPLWREECLRTGYFTLPVLADVPTAGYSFLDPNQDHIQNVKWIDNRKPLFTVQLDSYSSIFAQDPYIDRFFRVTSSFDTQTHISSYLHSSNLYEELTRAISDLANAETDSLVKFIHIILNNLIHLLVRPPQLFFNQNKPNSDMMKSFQKMIFEKIVIIVNKINQKLYVYLNEMRCGILATFVQYQAMFPQPEIRYQDDIGLPGNAKNDELSFTFHELIVHHWLVCTDVIRDKLYENAYFFFDIIFKSLCIHISLCGGLSQSSRHMASKYFLTNVTELINQIGDYVVAELKRFTVSKVSPSSPQSPAISSTIQLTYLNQSVAFFIRDLLSTIDRHFVFNLIKNYYCKLSFSPANIFTFTESNNEANSVSKQLSDSLFDLKVDFLRVLCGHEHFVALNLPLGTPLFTTLEQSPPPNSNPTFSPSSSFAKVMLNSSLFSQSIFDRIRPYAELTDDYRRQHWLLGLSFCILMDSFTRPKNQLQCKAANLFRSMLTSFDWDSKYTDPEIKSRISCLFFPLIGIMIDVIDQLHDPDPSEDNPFYSSKHNRIYSSKSAIKSSPSSSPGSPFIDNSIAMAIAGSVMNGANVDGLSSPSASLASSPQHYKHTLSYQPIDEETTRILLSCLLWVIGNIDQRLFRLYLNEFSNERLLAFLELLRLSTRIFQYPGERMLRKRPNLHIRKLEDVIRCGAARRELMRRRDYSQSFGSSDNGEIRLRFRKDSTLIRYNSLPRVPKAYLDDEVILEGYLCTMTNLIVIDTLALTLNIFRERTFRTTVSSLPSTACNLKNKYSSDEFVVGSILQALLKVLSLNQSTYVLEAAFHCQRALLSYFPEMLFVEGLANVEFCSELCYLLLKHCDSRIAAIRAQASASLYLLMRQNYQSTGNFSRIKIQITMSLSQLVGTCHSFNEYNIRRSLKSILTYALVDNTVASTQFPEQAHELMFNLHMILSDTMQMKEHKQDPEMLLDLMYRVAKGYQNSPELRLTWLRNMAQKHSELSQHVEAAQCYVHAAAIVAECLHKVARRPYLPVSCAAFQKVCPNVFEESLTSNVEISVDKSNIGSEDSSFDSNHSVQSAKLFSETGLVWLLERSANCFDVGNLYEAVNEAYKLLIPIHEAHHRYSELVKVHSLLKDVFTKIQKQEGKRVYATYFRVGFYGSLFADLDSQEFVYKEPFLTKLPEISNRLETFYSSRFGQENVEVIKDSNPVDISKLNPSKAYIQITYVEPYYDSWELESRATSFERNYNTKRFIYSTPFTYDGRAHGALYEQCKRKTILTTEHAFPYVKTRVNVRDRQQLVLSPIEVAIEDVQKKTNELANAANSQPVDPKILQMVLQGCVGTTVNQGPAEVAFVFLSDEPNMPANCQRPAPSLQNKLRIAFKEFCSRCGEALKKNHQLVNGHEQQLQYHKELERNFYKFTDLLAPLMGIANLKQSLLLLRQSYFTGFNAASAKISNGTANDNPRYK